MNDVTVSSLSEVHRAYLTDHAISDEVIDRTRIRSEGDHVIFPWRDGNLVTEQRRIWPEPEGGLPPDHPKYLWPEGSKPQFWAIRPLEDLAPDCQVIFAEGTKQALAVASHAPAGYAIYGMPGCDIGRVARLGQAGLKRFAGHQVIIMLDADAADNLNVYEGGEKLAEMLEFWGAGPVVFTRLPSQGTDGVDDFLALTPAELRAETLATLLARTQPEPAERRPSRRKVPDQLPETGGLPLVVVNKNRREVIREILWHLQQKWNGTNLFCYGGALTRLRGAATEPLEEGAFLRWLVEAVCPVKFTPAGLSSPARYEATWPDQQTVKALMASGEEFAPLVRVSTTPFIRPDGTVCAKNGYDPDTSVMLVTGNSGMDQLDVPDMPSRDQAMAAADFLLGEWLGDDPETGKHGMPWRDDASRAGALALVLTPFIRGLVPLAPLAVISGLQPGVGKGLLADCIQLMIAGESSPPLPWSQVDDEENRKQITSAFRAGANLVWFDEAHQIESLALSRAITSLTYGDRILGLTKQVSWPNQVTWLATGNQVRANADMGRRSYWIELHPDVPDPENLPESYFRHPELRSWTTENRPRLITAALIVIRSWYAAGCPPHSRGTLMGSFEGWDKIMSGILDWAGVSGFLANLSAKRAERDIPGGLWADHLTWARSQFGDNEFTTRDVKTKAQASDGEWDAPPGLGSPVQENYTTLLGQEYGRHQDRWYGMHRIRNRGKGAANKTRWVIERRDLGEPGSQPNQPNQPNSENPSLNGYQPDQGEVGKVRSDPAAPGETGKVRSVRSNRSLQLRASAHDRAHADAHAHTRARGVTDLPNLTGSPDPAAPLVVRADIETDDAGRLFLTPRGAPLEDGGFVRLAGIMGPGGDPLIESIPDFIQMLEMADRIDGHNFAGFDGLALAWHHGMDWNRLAPKIRDTELIARQVNPPRSRDTGGSSQDRYSLDQVAAEMGLTGKTDDLKRLRGKHGGYAAIPLDDPEYRSYLEGDLRATAAVSDGLMRFYESDPYLPREHRVAQIAGQIRLNGFCIDTDLLGRRVAEVNGQKRGALAKLHESWGLPLDKAVMKGRGKDRHEEREVLKSPLAGKAGRSWLEQMYARYGIADPPRTGKSHELAIGADDLKQVTSRPDCPEELRAMIGFMDVATGARSVYQNAATWLAPDGRVHPKISFRQASGRWSFLDPGLTVFGKHDGKHVERDIFRPDQGEFLVSFDLSQVDMRAIAGHCQDPGYMALFAPGRDVHSEIAAQVFGDPKRRQDAKARGHGWNYGMGPDRMIRDGVDPEMAYGFDNGMRDRFPGLCAWREDIRRMGEQGQILYNGFGRRMRCEPRWAYTVAPALMGQGGARDIMCECLLRLPAWTWPMLRGMVHDEIILSVPPEALFEVVRVVTAAMTWTWLGVPILCDINGPGLSWGEISGKCGGCGNAHGPGFCELHAQLKGMAARHEMAAS